MTTRARKFMTLLANRQSYDAYLTALLAGHDAYQRRMDETSASAFPAIARNRLFTMPGANLLTDGGIEVWDSPTVPHTPWTRSLAGGTSINQETSDVHGGSSAARIDVVSGAGFGLLQAVTFPAGDTIQFQCYGKVTANSFRMDYGASQAGSAISNTGTYALARQRHIAATANADIRLLRGVSSGTYSIYVDDVVAQLVGQYDAGYNGPTLAGDTVLGRPAPTLTTNDYLQDEFNRLEGIFKPETPTAFTKQIVLKMAQADIESATAMTVWCIGVDANNIYTLRKPSAGILRFTHIHDSTAVDLDYYVTGDDYGKALLVTCVGDGVNAHLYVKDWHQQAALSAGTWSASALTAAFSREGSVNGGEFLTGTLADSTFVATAFTADEIAQLQQKFNAQESAYAPNSSDLAYLTAGLTALGAVAGWVADTQVYDDATTETVVADGGNVRGWKSLVGTYKPAQAGDVPITPTYRAGTAGVDEGRAKVEKDGADLMALTSGWNGLVTYTGPWTWFTIFKTTTSQTDRVLVLNGSGATFRVEQRISTTNVSGFQRGATSGNQAANSPAATPHDGVLHIAELQRASSTSMTCLLDGVAGTANTNAMDDSTVDRLYFGCRVSSNFYVGYHYATVLIPTVTNAAKLRTLLAWYYGKTL